MEPLPLAAFSGDDLASILVPMMALAIPIVAIVSSHRRKMAEILAQTRSQTPNSDVQALREEIGELKALVHQQAIMVDTLVSTPKPAIEERMRV